MRKLIFITIITAVLAACSNGKPQGELGLLKAEKDSLKSLQETIGNRIAELDEQITLLDTTKKLLLVTIQDVTIETFNHYFEVQGNVEAEKNTMVYPEMGGTIRKINVKEGQRVKKGALLIELDKDILQNNIREAQTAYELSNTVYAKQARLWEQKIGSELQYLEAKTNKEALEARMAALHAQLDLLMVRAPFDGIIDEIFPKIGELAAPQMPLLRVVNLSKVYIESDVSEKYLGDIKKGTDVMISLPSYKESMPSKIDLIGNYINPNNRTFKIQVQVENKDEMLKPNLLAKIKIKDFSKDSTVVLRESLIQQTPAGEDFIYLLDKKGENVYAQKKIIKTGLSYDNMVMVTEGLKGGEQVIDKGSRSVKNGQRVEIAG